MHRKTTLVSLLILALYSSQGIAITEDELQSLQGAVIQMCRGGTFTGSETRIESSGQNELVVKNLFADSPNLSIKLVKKEWNGIKALIDPSNYSECVQFTLNLLVPAIDSKRNIDNDLNARMEYINSGEFCKRLIHVVSLAPLDFTELRNNVLVKNNSKRNWPLGPYIMGNPGALNMKMSNRYQGAKVYFSSSMKKYLFIEDLLFTAKFGLSSEIGYVFKQIEKAIDKCLTPKAFHNVDGVRYSSGPHTLSSGAKYWNFDETAGFLGATSASFIVSLGLRNIENKQFIDLMVHAPD